MDVSKRIGGVRYNLCQDKRNQITVKKEKDVVMVQNLDHRLRMNDAFDLLDKVASGEYHMAEMKRNEEKLNMETKEEIKEKVEIPEPNPCLFCGGIPKVINLRQADSRLTCRALQCTGLNCTTSKSIDEQTGKVKSATFKYWTFTVDVVDPDEVDKADIKLINEWNKRMPLRKEG